MAPPPKSFSRSISQYLRPTPIRCCRAKCALSAGTLSHSVDGRVGDLQHVNSRTDSKMKWLIVALTLALAGCMGWNPYGGYNDPAEDLLQEEETQKQDKRDDYGQ